MDTREDKLESSNSFGHKKGQSKDIEETNIELYRQNSSSFSGSNDSDEPQQIPKRPSTSTKVIVPTLTRLRSEAAMRRPQSAFIVSNRQSSRASSGRPVSIRDRPLGGTVQAMKLMSPREAKNYVLEHGSKELEQDGSSDDGTKGIDPFAQQKRPSFKLAKKIWIVIGFIPIISWILLIICWAIDKVTEPISGTAFSMYDLVYATFNPDVDQGRSIVEATLNTMSVLFGLLITVIGIILQLSANRFTSHVTSLFFKDATIGLFLAYVIFCNVFTFWVYLSIGERYVPRASVLLAVFMVISQLMFLFPFLAYLFFFLEPDKVVQKIMMNGLTAASESINDHGRDIDKQQVKATLAVEHLMDAANSALKKKDKNITAEIVDALCSFVIAYGNYKATHKMNVFWFKVPVWIRQSPDFLTLSDSSVEDINDRKTWMEWKILRQYQMLFNESLLHMKELCYHIAMNSRLVGETAAKRGDLSALDLTVKFFNTYLRAGINMSDVRTVYNVLFQFRTMAEYIVEYGNEIAKDGATEENDLELRAVRIAKFMRYYSFVCLQQKLVFLVEVISHDIRELCITAHKCNSVTHEKLLQIFLTVDDGSDGVEDKALQGVRRAQVLLATYYLCANAPEHARKIYEDFPGESHKRLWGLMQELQNVTNKEMWEVSERGTNFNFLTPEQKAQLPIFFSYFKNFISDKKEDHLTPAERKKVERQQELLNFD